MGLCFKRFRALIVAAVATCVAGCATRTVSAVVPVPDEATVHRQASWMASDATKGNLLYVADPGSQGVLVYSYPPSRYRLVGFLTPPTSPAGECVDAAQHVFVTANNGMGSKGIFEYSHGGTRPIAMLGFPNGYPLNCAVAKGSGDLAVVGVAVSGSQLAIFKHARGKPKLYTLARFGMFACAFDNGGNLFVDGDAESGQLQFAELPSGGQTFTTITLNQTFHGSGGVQWLGDSVLIGDSSDGAVYRFRISGDTGTEIGATTVSGSSEVLQFSIAGDRIVEPSAPLWGPDYVKIFGFPAGGSAKRTLSNFSTPIGVVLSLGRN